MSERRSPSYAPSSRANLVGHRVGRRLLELEHVPVEVRRPAHGLARVVDDEVEPVARLVQVPAELLDARRVTQIEAEDLEPIAPVVEVGLLRVPGRRVPRKPRRHDQRGSGSQQLDPGLVADLHPSAREQRDAAAEVGGLGPLGVVEVAAREAELVVERVDLDVALLADVAVLEIDHLSALGVVDLALHEVVRREHVRRREHRLLAQDADARLGEHVLVVPLLRRLLPATERLPPLAALDDIGVEDVPGRGEQPMPVLERQVPEQTAVSNDGFERLDRLPQSGGVPVLVRFCHGPRVAGQAR